jgi:UDP-N-acetylglucosamine/UDP-N-acetylgalactosamine diphosphorylase
MYCVDNILVKVGDPVFMGYCISKGAECANKVVRKGFPTEAVGITCKVEGHYQVVEYSEITQKSAEKRNKDGSLVYGAANICIHFFTFEFLERVVMLNEDSLQHHVAKKKIPFVDASGSIVKPEKPNGIKMEKFVFDVFQFAKNFVVWECLRDEEFAPLKNAAGASDFTPEHCRNSLLALHQKWLRIAGAKLLDINGKEARQMGSPAGEDNNNDPDNNNDEKGYVVMAEISPLVSYAGENLEAYKGQSLQLPLSIN